MKPSVSAMQAMVEAVPITMQVPEVGISWSCARSRSGPSSEPARNAAHSRRQSVQAPSRVPSCLPASIEPTLTTIAGMSAEIAPISSAGMVLSQPPISTTASSGSALIISSTSIAIRLRSSIEVGNENASCSETVGNTNGSAPAIRTPREIGFGDLRRGLVAGVEVGGGGEDADDRPVERLVGEARALEEAAPQEQRELLVAVLGEAGPQAFFHGNSPDD